MALYGVLGDIHGNHEALSAVLADLRARGVERIVCLGDVVGYNADPDECVALVRSACAVTIAGNHDLIGIGRLGFERCSNKAAYSLRRTRRVLKHESAAWLGALPASHRLEKEIVLVHGGVRDVQQYMTTPAHIAENARFLAEDFAGARVCFFGHSHEPRVYEVDGESAREIGCAGELVLDKQKTYFINPGSVDAQRKSRDKLAQFAIYDSSSRRLQLLCCPYYAPATEAKAAAFGYRIVPLTDHLYTFRKRLQKRGRTTISAASALGKRGLSLISGLLASHTKKPA